MFKYDWNAKLCTKEITDTSILGILNNKAIYRYCPFLKDTWPWAQHLTSSEPIPFSIKPLQPICFYEFWEQMWSFHTENCKVFF